MKFNPKRILLTGAGLFLAFNLAKSIIPSTDFSLGRSNKQQTRNSTNPVVQLIDEKNYALLVNGRPSEENDLFSSQVQIAYNSLIKIGYSEENIYVLDSRNNPYSDAAPSMNNFVKTLDELADKITSSDMVFYYFTNHGGKLGNCPLVPSGESVIPLNDSDLSESSLASLLKEINANYQVFLFTACYSGGFAEKSASGNNIGISSCSSNKFAHRIDDHPTFDIAFFFLQFQIQLMADCLLILMKMENYLLKKYLIEQ